MLIRKHLCVNWLEKSFLLHVPNPSNLEVLLQTELVICCPRVWCLVQTIHPWNQTLSLVCSLDTFLVCFFSHTLIKLTPKQQKFVSTHAWQMSYCMFLAETISDVCAAVGASVVSCFLSELKLTRLRLISWMHSLTHQTAVEGNVFTDIKQGFLQCNWYSRRTRSMERWMDNSPRKL